MGMLGGRSFLEALEKNKSIVKLEMAGNNIPSEILKTIGKLCLCVCVCVLKCNFQQHLTGSQISS